MKKVIVMFVALLIYNPLDCQEPQCGEYLDCSNTETAHRYCDEDGKTITKCVQNPYKTEWGTPMRIPEANKPICLKFDGSGPDLVLANSCTVREKNAYCKSDFENDMNWALNEWLCLCGMEEEECQCEIDIKFSENKDNFKNPDTQTSTNTLYLNPENVLNSNCEIDCSKLTILLNYTDEFCGEHKGKEGDYVYDHFFVSDCGEETFEEKGIRNCVNLKSVILYQLACIFGFGELWNGPCYDGAGVMHSSYSRAPDGYSKRPATPHISTKNDKCTFMKLYCPELAATLVEDELQENRCEAYIFNGQVTLFFETKTYSRNVNIELYSILGEKVVSRRENNLTAGEHSIAINSENLTPGIYFAKIESENHRQIKKLIILR